MACFASLTEYVESQLYFPPLPVLVYPQAFDAEPELFPTPCKGIYVDERVAGAGVLRPGAPSYTVVYCHGNNENLVKCAEYLRLLSSELNADAFAFEYPGYVELAGEPAGRPSEAGCYDAATRFVKALRPMARAPIVMVGFSMGCAPALKAACAVEGVSAVVLLAPFVSAISVALGRTEEKLAWHRWWAPLDVMCTLPLARGLQCRLLVIHGAADDVIPPAHGRAVSAAAPCGEFLELAEAHHSNVARSEEAVDKMRRWLASA